MTAYRFKRKLLEVFSIPRRLRELEATDRYRAGQVDALIARLGATRAELRTLRERAEGDGR